jgi:hypothetical protein
MHESISSGRPAALQPLAIRPPTIRRKFAPPSPQIANGVASLAKTSSRS